MKKALLLFERTTRKIAAGLASRKLTPMEGKMDNYYGHHTIPQVGVFVITPRGMKGRVISVDPQYHTVVVRIAGGNHTYQPNQLRKP